MELPKSFPVPPQALQQEEIWKPITRHPEVGMARVIHVYCFVFETIEFNFVSNPWYRITMAPPLMPPGSLPSQADGRPAARLAPIARPGHPATGPLQTASCHTG